MLIMKNFKILIAGAFLSISISSFSQQMDNDGQNGKFKRENIFLGTGFNLGLGNHSFNV